MPVRSQPANGARRPDLDSATILCFSHFFMWNSSDPRLASASRSTVLQRKPLRPVPDAGMTHPPGVGAPAQAGRSPLDRSDNKRKRAPLFRRPVAASLIHRAGRVPRLHGSLAALIRRVIFSTSHDVRNSMDQSEWSGVNQTKGRRRRLKVCDGNAWQGLRGCRDRGPCRRRSSVYASRISRPLFGGERLNASRGGKTPAKDVPGLRHVSEESLNPFGDE
jgi:hypothetical protein